MNSGLKYWIAFAISWVLVLATSTKNSSKTNEFYQLESLSASEHLLLNQLFYSDLVSEVDSFLKTRQKRYRFNGNVLLASQNEIIFEGSYGYKDLNKKDTLEIDDAFQLASVSKQFTAAGILLLNERGLLNLDDTISKFFPEFPYSEITVDMLLHHTSGLPNYMWMLEHHWKKESIPNNQEMISLMAQLQLPLYFTPGRRYDYSNTGYAVLAAVIEVTSHMSYKDFIENEIFAPLGMNDSFVYSINDSSSVARVEVPGFIRGWRRWRIYDPTIHDGLVGDKGVYASARDLFKWDQALYSNKILNQESIEIAFTEGKIRNRWSFPYGCGFRIKYSDGDKIVYHHGLWEGFRNTFTRNIDKQLTVIVLSNNSCRASNSIGSWVEHKLYSTSKKEEIQIIQYTLDFGLAYGKEKLDLIRENNPGFQAEPEIFELAENFLLAQNKNQLASRIHQLNKAL